MASPKRTARARPGSHNSRIDKTPCFRRDAREGALPTIYQPTEAYIYIPLSENYRGGPLLRCFACRGFFYSPRPRLKMATKGTRVRTPTKDLFKVSEDKHSLLRLCRRCADYRPFSAFTKSTIKYHMFECRSCVNRRTSRGAGGRRAAPTAPATTHTAPTAEGLNKDEESAAYNFWGFQCFVSKQSDVEVALECVYPEAPIRWQRYVPISLSVRKWLRETSTLPAGLRDEWENRLEAAGHSILEEDAPPLTCPS
jgi:hypothetical protein